MIKRFILLCILPFYGNAQFTPAAGQPGTSAIKKDSSIIINWASGCTVTRGLQDISNTSLGYANVGDSSKATGPADGVNVVSLGDGGVAVLTFPLPVKNLAGPDFCVFENSFDPGFLELAFVEVSSDGINFTRFPATCNIQNTVQIGPFDTTSDPAKINNLAGKYIGGYGVPFDLQELQGVPGLDVNAITHVKIIDVVGCVQSQYGTRDQNNNLINDPWSTPFASGGFDLDAVGVINQAPVGMHDRTADHSGIKIFPTVVSEEFSISNAGTADLLVEITGMTGEVLLKKEIRGAISSINIEHLASGVYFVTITSSTRLFTAKIVKAN
jgi:hypothetical protein